ncbi:hypothetical protein [Thalassorhabdomicrobium marinisediminis]|uniref:hypothetical protein n=1 Tax=Thalassorhabdomicrobium marinisediminis TaxID=2170577 RepID=UPI002493CC26|nr:hypothetical protein [Thalassorhabdomicrobium marinisediminis]
MSKATLSIYVLAISLNTFAYVNGKYGTAATVMALPFSAFLGFLLYRERLSGRVSRCRGALIGLIAGVANVGFLFMRPSSTTRWRCRQCSPPSWLGWSMTACLRRTSISEQH